jgi:hypothetical protein
MDLQIGFTSYDAVRTEHDDRRERLTRDWPRPGPAGADGRDGTERQQPRVRHGLRYLAPVLGPLSGWRRHHRHA